MKNKPLMLGMLAVAMAVSTGCTKTDTSETYPANDDTNSMSGQVKEATTNAWQKTKEFTTNAMSNVREGTTNAWANLKESLQSATDYTYDKKEDFVAGATTDMTAVDQQISQLSDKVANASDSVKASAQAKLQQLNAQRATLGHKLDDVKNATEANWNDVKTGFTSSYDDVKASLKQAWQDVAGN
jgi:D-ribose pyranose/furanose isomerase RbsD